MPVKNGLIEEKQSHNKQPNLLHQNDASLSLNATFAKKENSQPRCPHGFARRPSYLRLLKD
jgi:hypothetical protein